MKNHFVSVTLWASLGAVALGIGTGCSDSDTEPKCPWKLHINECRDPDKTSADEVGDGDGDGSVEEEFCSVEDKGVARTVYQCDGMLTASMHFNTIFGDCAKTLGDPRFCSESHFFGVEPYEMPEVMACCDATGTPEDEVLTYCAMDLVEQVCRSIPLRLQNLIETGVIKIGKLQAKKLREWLDQNWQDCYNSLYSFSGSPGVIMPAKWLVNNGKNPQWPMLHDFTITLEKAIIKSATVPDDESDHVACVDNTSNDSEIFESSALPPSPGVVKVRLSGASSPTAPIDGPPTPDAQRVTGSATIASLASGCQEPRCSALATSIDSATGALLVEDMDLFADGTTSIAYGPWSIDIDNAALRLYGTSRADSHHVSGSRDDVYVIQPGHAHFVISGIHVGAHGHRWATNSQPVILRQSNGGWSVERFSISHTDALGQVWTVTIPETEWN